MKVCQMVAMCTLFLLAFFAGAQAAEQKAGGSEKLELMLETKIRDQKHAEKVCPKAIRAYVKGTSYKNPRWLGTWENLGNGKGLCHGEYDK